MFMHIVFFYLTFARLFFKIKKKTFFWKNIFNCAKENEETSQLQFFLCTMFLSRKYKWYAPRIRSKKWFSNAEVESYEKHAWLLWKI